MNKILKRFMSWLLLVVYLIGNPTTMVYAEMISTNPDDAVSSVTVGSTTNEGDIEVTKSVEPKRDSDGSIISGEYTINFDIKGKSTTHSDTYPIYTVVVFDRSGSMIQNNANLGVVGTEKWANAKAGAIYFTELLKNDDVNKFALVTFSTGVKVVRDTFTSDVFVDSDFDYPDGGTSLYKALIEAENIIDKAPNGVKKTILVISDGRPDDYSNLFDNGYQFNNTNVELKDSADLTRIKNKATILTIGYSIEKDTGAQHLLSSVASKTDYFSLAKPSDIKTIVSNIATEISKQPAATGASIVEAPATEFSLASGETGTKKLENIDENTQRVSYDIKIDEKNTNRCI